MVQKLSELIFQNHPKYLNLKKNKGAYDIVWREESYSSKIPFVKNLAKWRLIRTSDYIENLFDNPRILYNIRIFWMLNNKVIA